MKSGLKSIAWIAEAINPESVVCLLPDAKARILDMVCQKVKRRMFRYTGIDLPANPMVTVKDKQVPIAKEPQYSGFVINRLTEPQPSNAALAICEPHTYKHVWHCPFVLLWGEEAPEGFTKIAQVPGEPAMWAWPKERIPAPKFQVKTRNCVDDRIIQHNVLNSVNLGLPHVPKMAAHGEVGLVFGGGPSIVNHLNLVRQRAKQDRLCCVKTSHDLLLDAGIVPWACFLLDPRAHVKDFIAEPDPRVLYIVSSTCNPSTFDRLLSRGARVWLYHALVGASEDSMVRMHIETMLKQRREFAQYCRDHGLPPPEYPHWEWSDQMVAGGTTAGSRGLSVLHMMGFRRFVLAGFDSCYFEPKDLKETKQDGQPKYQHLMVGGKAFFTDAELVAQVQDFQHLPTAMPDCIIEVLGEGMIAQMYKGVPTLPKLHEVFPAT